MAAESNHHTRRLPARRHPLLLLRRGQPREPINVHAGRGDAEAKSWLNPDVGIADSSGYTRREQAELVRIVTARRQEIVEAWHEHFG